jgi:hypothetical protein
MIAGNSAMPIQKPFVFRVSANSRQAMRNA